MRIHVNGRRAATIIAPAILVASLVAACGSDNGDSGSAAPTGSPSADAGSSDCSAIKDTTPIDISFGIPSDVVEYMPWQFGLSEGLFERAGIKLDIHPNIKPPTLVASVVSNSIDVDAASGGLMVAALGGAPVRRFMDTQAKSLQSIWADSSIKEIKDLKGKKIAITALGGAISESVLRILSQNGIDVTRDVQQIATGTLANSLAALEAGQVSAAVVSTPLDLLAAKKGFHELFQVADFVEDSPVGLGTSTSQLKSERTKFLRLVNASYDAIAYVRSHKPEAVSWIASHYGLTAEDAAKAYDLVTPTYVTEARASVTAEKQELASSDLPNPTDADLNKTVDYSLTEAVLACRKAG